MKKIISFKNQIKGNIHTHTTRTDGEFSVDEIRKLYKEKGYRFIAITDHRIYYRQNFNYDEIVVLNGCEFNCYLENDNLGETVHFHILALEDVPCNTTNPIKHNNNEYKSLFFKTLNQVQDLVNELKNRGNLIMIAHPKNNKIPLDLLKGLKGYHGVEVFNAKAKSDASDYVHELVLKNRDIFFTAVDDSHKYFDDNEQTQYFNGFIVIEDRILNKENIIDAIKEKKFYASNGPKIEEIIIEGNKIFIKCSDVKEIVLIIYGENESYKILKASNKASINEAEFLVPVDINFIRFECIKEDGKKAWSNRIEVNKV